MRPASLITFWYRRESGRTSSTEGWLESPNDADVGSIALIGNQEQAITLVERLLSTPGPVGVPDCPQNITLAELRLR